jgi:hypothetical protein
MKRNFFSFQATNFCHGSANFLEEQQDFIHPKKKFVMIAAFLLWRKTNKKQETKITTKKKFNKEKEIVHLKKIYITFQLNGQDINWH